MALPALDQGVGEALDVAGGLPDAGVHEDGGVQADHVVALVDDGAPPGVLDVALELDAQGAVVPGGAEAAVDLGAGEDEAAAFAQRDDGVQVYGLEVALGHPGSSGQGTPCTHVLRMLAQARAILKGLGIL